jgi:carbamate kinase
MKLVVALGGNALLRRGQALTAANQLENIRRAATQLARVAASHEMVLTHGNGPQVGLLALQSAAYASGDAALEAYPLDVLGAQTDGMIGYLLEQELANLLPASRTVTTLLTRVEVDPRDPAFEHPTKPIGPVYTQDESQRIGAEKHWAMAPDGTGFRRVVASPQPLRLFGLAAIRWLLEHGALVIAAGGGGIPVARGREGQGHELSALHGIEAVIDKDLCSGLLARELQADCLVIATDVKAVSVDWGLPGERAIGKVTPQALMRQSFPAGTMGPKVEAACRFVLATGHRAVIGSLDEIEAMIAGDAGTQVCTAAAGGAERL